MLPAIACSGRPRPCRARGHGNTELQSLRRPDERPYRFARRRRQDWPAAGIAVRPVLSAALAALLSMSAIGSGLAEEPVSAAPMPVADSHLHYKWNQAEVTSPEQAVAALRANQVQLAVVTGTPAERALELQRLAPDIVVPIYGVYRTGGDWYGWQGRASLVDEVREALASGRYHGIGELHLIGGFAVRWQRSDVLKALLALAAEFDVPVLIHTEFSRADPTLSICQANPSNRLLLAHAGAALPPAEVERVLEACPNVWMDLSARDPWRFLRFPITDDEDRLLPDWEALVLRWPERFVIGSDAVWPVERLDAWDQADTGWQRIGAFLDFHRSWASVLPPEVQRKVLLENALALFKRPSAEPPVH
jgi:predicted TIM-barrel fold metal-dependent hydrolase